MSFQSQSLVRGLVLIFLMVACCVPLAAQEAKPAAKADKAADSKAADVKAADVKPAAKESKAAEQPAAADKGASDKTATDKSKDDVKPAPEGKSDAPATATSKTPAAPGAKAEFTALLDEWKTVLIELRKVRAGYLDAENEQQRSTSEGQWKSLVTKGNALLVKMQVVAMQDFIANKSNDPQLHRFLIKVAQDAVDIDDYERGAELALAMLRRYEEENAPPPKELYNVAGVCSFLVNDYDSAEKYLQLAKDSGSLKDGAKSGGGTPLGELYLGQLKKYREYWEKEKAVREKEDKADDLPRVKISTTAGDIVVELFENEAPDTVGNFVSLVEARFYDGLTFHRVLGGFMAQGGCPKGNGTGDAGYSIYCETNREDYRRHFRGSLSMAHAGKDTGGSQFFICFTPQEGLDGKHTGFGRVIEGFDVLAKFQRIDPMAPSPDIAPTKIIKAEVVRKREHKYLPRKVE